MPLTGGKFLPNTPDPEEVGRVLQQFIDTRNPVAQAIVDDLVRVRVGPAFNVKTVEILDSTIEEGLRQRLETAIVGAVNTALRRSTVAAGDALRQFSQQQDRTVPQNSSDTDDSSG
jgi:hypothetical protein